jgi:hypothetical protein
VSESRPLELSVILVTDRLATIRKTLAHFRAQEGSERLQLVIVAPRESAPDAGAAELTGFGDVIIVEVDDISQTPVVRAGAVQATRAPLVVFAETHSYPRSGYVDALIRAHREERRAVVGPSMANANGDSLVSWVGLFMDYGAWVANDRRGGAEDVPGLNSAYKREVLIEFGDDLAAQLRASRLLHQELRRRGYELHLEPDAVCDHLNSSRLLWSVAEHFQSGRKFAGQRARHWRWGRRLLFAGGSPLIPALRLSRILRDVRRSGHRELLPRLVAPLVLVLVASAIGELVGYVSGPGRSLLLFRIELFKSRYTRPADQLHDADERTWPSPVGA